MGITREQIDIFLSEMIEKYESIIVEDINNTPSIEELMQWEIDK